YEKLTLLQVECVGGRGAPKKRCFLPGLSDVTEGPDSPFLLSPIPGPSGRKEKVQCASRPGLSRIPGRDHRRYYHEYWRSEFLMDFDPRRHGMICMVCGSSLATLKLSTIKRHIRQKHPDSLLWSAADKEVIRSGWESHLSLEGGQRLYCPAGGVAAISQGQEEELLDCARHSTELPGPSAKTLERYLNDSLHAWFRQEFLMEYQAEEGRLVCMVCGRPLPSLHLDHIKSHVLDIHPQSLVYSSEEKHCILQTWAQTHGETEGGRTWGDLETIQIGSDTYAEDNDEALSEIQDMVDGVDGAPGMTSPIPPLPLHQPRKRRLRGGFPWRLRLDYMVAYGPQGRGTFCMVCSQALPMAKVSSFRRHIQECHPETTSLAREERDAMAEAWTKEAPMEDNPAVQMKEGKLDPSDIVILPVAREMADNNNNRTTKMATTKAVKKEEGVTTMPATPGRHGHYPGKDQRRNYQVRWRMEFLMDYDCRRHGLICMVCGATLATLKVSTIKRHIQQVHPHSLVYVPDERQQALLSYNQTALHFVHSDDCFSSQDHGHTALGQTTAGLFVR
uniref:Zinc finger translocation associated n=1 Tax=Oncorhynchus mykiss TaxID=8022 RepID=A0A8C7SQR7_ONCMY